MENNDNKRIDLSGSGCSEKCTPNISACALSTTVTYSALEKHARLINEGSNNDLLMCSKSSSPRCQYISFSAANVNSNTEAELLINEVYTEIHSQLPSDPGTSMDDKELLY